MRRWWHWLTSPRYMWRQRQAERQAARERELLEQQRRIDAQVESARAESEQAAQHTLDTVLAQFIASTPPDLTNHHSRGADRQGTPLLLLARMDQTQVEAQAVTAFGNCGHLEMTLQAVVDGELATLHEIHGDSHSRGIGTALLQFTEPLLAELGARVVRATLRSESPEHLARQLRFFEKNGYHLVPDSPEPVVEKRLG